MKGLRYGKNEKNAMNAENTGEKRKPFKNAKLAAVLASALALVPVACGRNDVITDTNNLLCVDETISVEKKSNEATVSIDETIVFPNGYKMTLVDIERLTQTAFFVLKDQIDQELYNIDMKEGVDYTIEFPAAAAGSPETKIRVAACSVRSGDAFNEVSATVRADVDLVVEPPVSEPCVPNFAPTDCHLTGPIAEGVMTKNQRLKVGNLMLYFEGTEDHEGTLYGIFRLDDSCGNPLAKDMIYEGQTVTFFIEGVAYEVDLFALHAADIATEWADVKVEVRCLDRCPVGSALLGLGDSIVLPDLKIRLDDVAVENGLSKALLSILDLSDNVLSRLALGEGEVEITGVYKIRVVSVAPGYSFGTKWAEISISSRDCE